MFCRIHSAAIFGVDAVPVAVEADASSGLPMFSIVGFVSSQVREAQDRVRTALRSYEVNLPPKRLTINLAPGDLRKDGTRFDLPIAAAVLGAIGEIDPAVFADTMVLGELRLDGAVERITGILPSVLCARQMGCTSCIVPAGNRIEAGIVDGIRVIGLRDIGELIAYARDGVIPEAEEIRAAAAGDSGKELPDFADIHGQASMKRAAVIAAAGFHNLLISGPPGAGKSMAAQRIPTILPPLGADEQLEISKLYSIAGLLPADRPLLCERPFRAPHHSLTPTALCGGGRVPRPGEVTLAHRGVLFLDEIAEMKRETIDLMRQPLEDHHVTISRIGGTFDFPAGFLLVAAMNPCPCGFFPDRSRCQCSMAEISLYRRRISHAFMDRIDLHSEMQAVSYQDLTQSSSHEEGSAALREKVCGAARVQSERYRGMGIHFNSELSAADMQKYCRMTEDGSRMLHRAFETLGLSARGYHHILRVARTIADLDSSDVISEAHISEAIICRNGD
ncbi:MAG: YifB family Mg chelatase-like AAA ATPase [Eubacterium sp.]|nr:YifB family Mg chelatase-like AAA ATPase [Eubacterium sp.]